MSEKYKKTYKYLNYIEHLLILVLTVTDCVSISAFASLVCVPVYITCSAVGIKIFAITAGIKKYKSKKHEKTVLLGKDKLKIIEVLISKALIDSYISHDEFVSVNNLFRKYNEMKIEIKNSVSCKKGGIHNVRTQVGGGGVDQKRTDAYKGTGGWGSV